MAEEKEEVVKKSKGSNLVLILVSVLLVVVLALGGLVIYAAFSGGDDEKTDEVSQQENKKDNKKKQDASASEIGVMYPLESFTVNLNSDGGNKYLKCRLELEQNVPTLTMELDKKKPVIKDAILAILSSKSKEEISTTKGKERLKEEIINKINNNLNDGFIKNLYFTDFVISE
ncbi:flagellar basal body-associated protein FliL [Campylobacter canadensis]|uniref:Flagellar protein FliL n=1 Tax=Campylobacter canadensis TaxID=449520 RepID=A0ABS7WS99_9BACT|nr:flagellar basal body-associated protein FliL [Campylobacter canadensis]MBZ7986944.1 flagellar basal body-associated protein FliL [Campylobacter canadensis]MBZ7994263.1 flagellar basal body-associated protein FliL [Campylobacter canadensis]MBZ7995745.1 flagellar basal body-associated protein FliL [Campylobacter canadensis]MBZ7997980.1 flagellar basal body-associated protein FliL [Campylobacter canadensis]MBZ7999595.1 flagellar basal body-associated protein FliL [Campylobacter canadensis]